MEICYKSSPSSARCGVMRRSGDPRRTRNSRAATAHPPHSTAPPWAGAARRDSGPAPGESRARSRSFRLHLAQAGWARLILESRWQPVGLPRTRDPPHSTPEGWSSRPPPRHVYPRSCSNACPLQWASLNMDIAQLVAASPRESGATLSGRPINPVLISWRRAVISWLGVGRLRSFRDLRRPGPAGRVQGPALPAQVLAGLPPGRPAISRLGRNRPWSPPARHLGTLADLRRPGEAG